MAAKSMDGGFLQTPKAEPPESPSLDLDLDMDFDADMGFGFS